MPPDHEIRGARQRVIMTLLEQAPIASQQQLVALLERRGIAATQSSVSRDLRDLGVARVGGRYVARAAENEPGLEEVAQFLRAIKPAGPFLTVVLTTAGAAQSVGLAIDHAAWPEVVGTMAGDDTVFVATAEAGDQHRLLQRLRGFLKET
ncbi:MAG TPA: hypothetical protein VHR45_10415 [Thermoanaerobaculia bacterium]|nr:hypothetical protein [Thermoanaerobaculia bacterium]